MLTIPKSGTHLLEKLLHLISEKEKMDLILANLTKKDQWNQFFPDEEVSSDLVEKLHRITHKKAWPLVHLNRSNLFEMFINQYPSTAVIIGVRDLRDISVSLTHWRKKKLNEVLGEESSFAE